MYFFFQNKLLVFNFSCPLKNYLLSVVGVEESYHINDFYSNLLIKCIKLKKRSIIYLLIRIWNPFECQDLPFIGFGNWCHIFTDCSLGFMVAEDIVQFLPNVSMIKIQSNPLFVSIVPTHDGKVTLQVDRPRCVFLPWSSI